MTSPYLNGNMSAPDAPSLILEALGDLGSGSPKDVTNWIENRYSGLSFGDSTIREAMNRMVDDGRLDRPRRAVYTISKSGDKPSRKEMLDNMVEVPLYGSVGAGPGMAPMPPDGFILVQKDEYLYDFREVPDGNRTSRLGYFIVEGRSAAPTYFDKERVPVRVYNEPTQSFRNDVVYIFRWMGDLMIKELRLLSNDEEDGMVIRAKSLNPSIDPQIIHVRDVNDFAVVASVIEPPKQQLYATFIRGKLFDTNQS